MNTGLWKMDSGLAAARRPGMTDAGSRLGALAAFRRFGSGLARRLARRCLSAAAFDRQEQATLAARGCGFSAARRRFRCFPQQRLHLGFTHRAEGARRFECLLDQVYVSLDLASACLNHVDRLSGPVNVRLPKVVKAPEGHTYAWTENPLGINGYYLVSRGEKTPWRLKLRTASYANVQALTTLLPGCLVPDLIAVLGSMFFVVGDIDK